MTTVGYGDYSIKTDLGRLICFLGSVFGIISLSLIVLAFQQQISFNPL